MKDRSMTGESIKTYCARVGIHANTYFYWQKKLREAASEKVQQAISMIPAVEINGTEDTHRNPGERKVPLGWTKCSVTDNMPKPEVGATTIPIQIGRCTIQATSETDMAALERICQILVSLC
jgi:putative transposase